MNRDLNFPINNILEKFGGSYNPDFGINEPMEFEKLDTLKNTKQILLDFCVKNPKNERIFKNLYFLKVLKFVNVVLRESSLKH